MIILNLCRDLAQVVLYFAVEDTCSLLKKLYLAKEIEKQWHLVQFLHRFKMKVQTIKFQPIY